MAEKEFLEILADLDNGTVNQQLTDLLPKVTRAVMATGKCGALTLTLKVDKQGGMIILSPDVKVKEPQPDAESTMFFTDEEGNLYRDNPRQPELRGLEAPTELRAIKEV